jgi:peroxiredoxin
MNALNETGAVVVGISSHAVVAHDLFKKADKLRFHEDENVNDAER